MWLKGLTLEREIVKNLSVSLSSTLTKNEKVEYYIRIKTLVPIRIEFKIHIYLNHYELNVDNLSTLPESILIKFELNFLKKRFWMRSF